ncbi:hypothetical protein HPB50_000971 [Hyalomma asiaticum]|uniref:Uncharacterized protein n=1 Tax=Hyalomma asiaticum TaxID=266040 RepID=A0ACB7TAJ6_HYAAI|nr:hypothetical protein HPB50_000971 [Hyalomma asiaticum]
MAALGRAGLLLLLLASVVLVGCSGQAADENSAPERQHRGFQQLRLSTARGFGKRGTLPAIAALLGHHVALHRVPEPQQPPVIKKGFRNMKISTARGFGKRAESDTSFLLENDDFDPMDFKNKRDIRRISLSTARGFGKRLSPASSDESYQNAGQPVTTWLAEEMAKGDLNDEGAVYQDAF